MSPCCGDGLEWSYDRFTRVPNSGPIGSTLDNSLSSCGSTSVLSIGTCMGVSKNEGPNTEARVVGILLQGHP